MVEITVVWTLIKNKISIDRDIKQESEKEQLKDVFSYQEDVFVVHGVFKEHGVFNVRSYIVFVN